ncbi:MAG: glycosyltransferase [Candidatus Marinimicrobia bacterium]|nr:glycosyltransferase [Candidatus Neomarinimicrobiota bacterium]
MALVDMHLHSKYSGHPSEWFLNKLGASESYTEPEHIYKTLKEKGMDFVTITDHNKIGGILELRKKHPQDTFMGVETTAYFPEDGCKIHILIYDFTEDQFKEIDRLRENIYELRDYIQKNKLMYSVAHATYPVNNNLLTMDHLEKLILLFDIFEGVNGGRNYNNNHIWSEYLKSLTKEDLDRFYAKYQIEPISDTPWVKGFTGGSDDHAAIFLGKTFTNTPGRTLPEFIDDVKNKRGIATGRSNNYQGLAFTIYKIAYEYINTKTPKLKNTPFGYFAKNLFGEKNGGIVDNVVNYKLKYFGNKKSNARKNLVQLLENTREHAKSEIDTRFEVAYNDISNIADDLVKDFLISLEKKLFKGDFLEIMSKISSLLPSLFIALPFFTSLSYSHNSKHLLSQLKKNSKQKNDKKILWLTDTITDLNGVAETLKKIGWIAARNGRHLVIASSLTGQEEQLNLPPNFVNLPFLYSFSLPYYKTLQPTIPSILKSLKIFEEINPDEIYISTPGPVGLLGLLAGKLLNLKCTGIYHTDFTFQLKSIADDGAAVRATENYTKWFYDQLDEIRVPSHVYIDMLENRGFNKNKMKIFKRGIDGNLFAPTEKKPESIRDKYGIKNGNILLFAGRISKDKNLDFLFNIFQLMKENDPELNLMIVGDGPYLESLISKYDKDPKVYFTGKLDRNILPELYSIADVFVFPSNTDTFGMVVLEAQACGLPAVVSNQGGPGEIIINDRTGYALPTVDASNWKMKIDHYLDLKKNNAPEYYKLRNNIRVNTLANANWDNVLNDIFDTNPVAA